MAAVLGLSPWKTPYQLWAEKTSEFPLEDSDSGVKRRGRRLEPVIVDWMREDYGINIVGRNQRYDDQELPFLSCEIDFEYEQDAICETAEVKTVHPMKAKEWGDPWSDEVPIYYTTQALFGQMITGRDSTLFAALIGADDLRPYRVRRDETLIQTIRLRAVAFWELVETRVAPPITTLDDAALRWARESGTKQVEATSEIEEIAEKIRLIRKGITGDQAKADYYELELKKYMGDALTLVGTNGKPLATWKHQVRKGYTVEPTEFRMLRLSGGKSE